MRCCSCTDDQRYLTKVCRQALSMHSECPPEKQFRNQSQFKRSSLALQTLRRVMEAAKHDKRTVFVRGIPFTTRPDEFEAHFSELGPVRTSFLVKDKGQHGHKGFGFVQYALPEDAQKAAEHLHNTELQGRKLKVSYEVTLCQFALLHLTGKRQQINVLAGGASSQTTASCRT